MHNYAARPKNSSRTVIAAVSMLVLLASTGGALSGGRGYVPANSTWRTECGACHVTYPPSLLPARSWRAMMTSLDKHFGTDASLDPAAAAEISSFLEHNGGPDRGPTTSLRITDTPWFLRKHRKLAPAVWARPAIKSPANCSACHPAAERGHYDDDSVMVPR
jgi:Dihaem cytochrome c